MSESQAPRFPHQPGRVKEAKPDAFMRAMRSKSFNRRPVCPNCGQTAPAPDRVREDFAEPYGHRRPDGEPCPGFRKRAPIAAPPPMQLKPVPAFTGGTYSGPTVALALFDVGEQLAPANDVAPRRRVKAAKPEAVEVRVPPVLLLFASVEDLEVA